MAQAPAATLTQNVLREVLILSRTPDPAVMVIFGASGDLTARKWRPALYTLPLNRYLPSGFSVIGVADTPLSEDDFRAHMADAVRKFSRTQPVDRAVWQSVAEGLSYVRRPLTPWKGVGGWRRGSGGWVGRGGGKGTGDFTLPTGVKACPALWHLWAR